MDEKFARKLSRQLKLLNFLLVFFTLIFVTGFVVAGVFTYRAAQEVRKANNKITVLEDKAQKNLDFRTDICTTEGSLSQLLQSQSTICD